MTEPALELATTPQLDAWRTGDAEFMLRAAESAVRRYCGWHIAPVRTDHVIVADGSGEVSQPLPTRRLVSVGAIEEEGTLLDVEAYDWSSSGYLTKVNCQLWTAKPRGIKATITHGWVDVPYELTAIVLAVAAQAADTAKAGAVVRDTAGPFSIEIAKNADGSSGGVILTPLQYAILDDRYYVPAPTPNDSVPDAPAPPP